MEIRSNYSCDFVVLISFFIYLKFSNKASKKYDQRRTENDGQNAIAYQYTTPRFLSLPPLLNLKVSIPSHESKCSDTSLTLPAALIFVTK